MSPAGFDAIVFDFDGLVLDTETPIFVAIRELFEAHGAEPLTHDEWAAEIGTIGGIDVRAELRARVGHVDEKLMTGARRRRDDLLADEIPRPGVVEWLDAAAQASLPTAIASSSEEEWVLGHLDRLSLREAFGPVLCRSGTLRPKPEPDLYDAACRALAVEPGRAVAVEDSPHGVAAAKSAGLACIGVPNDVTVYLDLSHADLVIGSLAEVSMPDAFARVGAISRG